MRTSVVVIGAGQAGLATSHQLTAAGIDHVVLERGEVAESWRSERWDSLRLLTPNWMTRLPGWRYTGEDPDGFMPGTQMVPFLDSYRRSFDAPVRTRVTVERVTACDDGFDVATSDGAWRADAVVAASGACSEASIPSSASEFPSSVEQLTALQYRNPSQLRSGPVLVVGASASGMQIADEVQASGRPVTIAVGEHIRLPRTYRGRDIHWWLEAVGHLDERYDEVEDISRARKLPSLQLVGSPEKKTLDLNSLTTRGVELVGKLMRVVGPVGQFSGGLANQLASADLKLNRLLGRIDELATERGWDDVLDAPSRPERSQLNDAPLELPLAKFDTVIWATGYRPKFSWLDPRAFDVRGRLAHDGGVAKVPGLFFMGLPFMRRRKSAFIDGVGPDAVELAPLIRRRLDRVSAARA